MKRFFTIIALCLICAFSFAENHTYAKCVGSVENFPGELLMDTAEIIIAYPYNEQILAVFNPLDTVNNFILTFLVQDSIVICDNRYSLQCRRFSPSKFEITYNESQLLSFFQEQILDTQLYIFENNNKFRLGYGRYEKECSGGYYYPEIRFRESGFFLDLNFKSNFSNSNPYHYDLFIYRRIDVPQTESQVDTCYIEVPVIETIYDTVINTIHDTTYLTVDVNNYIHDTVTYTIIDTIHKSYSYVHDTIVYTDTVYMCNESLTDTIYLEAYGTSLTYDLATQGITYFYDRVINVNGIFIKLYSADGKLIEVSNENIYMANKPKGLYLVTDGNGGYYKFCH